MPSLLLFILCIINIMTDKNEIKAQFSSFLIISWNILYMCMLVFVCIKKTQFNFRSVMMVKVLTRKTTYLDRQSVTMYG